MGKGKKVILELLPPGVTLIAGIVFELEMVYSRGVIREYQSQDKK